MYMRHTRIATACLWCMVVIALLEYRPVHLDIGTSFNRFCARVYAASDLGHVLQAADRAAGGR